MKHTLLAALLACVAISANAQKMYRCVSPKGGTTFSEMPCPSGQGGEITVKPSSGAAGNSSKSAPQAGGAKSKPTAVEQTKPVAQRLANSPRNLPAQ